MKFCDRPFNSIHILPGGDVWACGWMHLKFGNLVSQSLPEVWNSKMAQKARESILDGSFRYCRKESCPFLENDSLPDLNEEQVRNQSILTEVPSQGSIACDFTCNHMCPSCRSEIFQPTEKYENDLHTIISRLFPYINRFKKMTTNGNGEVFASKQLMEMLARLQPENPDFQLNLETNGSLFDEAHWKQISHLEKYEISTTVTPNSFETDTFKYLSGGDADVDRLTHNLAFIRDLRDTGKINHYFVSIVVQDRNFRELPSFTKRCLEEFHVDEVVIKPVYQWFGMKEDVYWFKNVRNPLHPYFNEYREMLRDPVFDDRHVFFWGNRKNMTASKSHPAYQYKINEDILLELIKVPDAGTQLCAALKKLGCTKVAVYTPEDQMGVLLADFLTRGGLTPKCFLQRFFPKETKKNGLPVYGFPDMDFQAVDMILVTDDYHLEKVSKDIQNSHYTGKILSFQELTKLAGERG
ncbi:MAG: SPASM domain-containing protein [Oscillospiraceae bacterium]|nr:SPASM domain-containing protein [Oscillospiraceae bacterium]